jgi:hypothetical protein
MNRKTGVMPTVFEPTEKSQTSCHKEERFTVQNRMTNASPIREQPQKTRLPIRHKSLYSIKKNPLCKTRKRAGAIEPALRFCGQRKIQMNRPAKSHPKSIPFYSTQVLVCHEERSAVQNKKPVGGAMMGQYWQTLCVQSDTPGIRNGKRNGFEVVGDKTSANGLCRMFIR